MAESTAGHMGPSSCLEEFSRNLFLISACLQLVLVSVDTEVYLCVFAVAGMLQVSPDDLGAALTADVQYFKGADCISATHNTSSQNIQHWSTRQLFTVHLTYMI